VFVARFIWELGVADIECGAGRRVARDWGLERCAFGFVLRLILFSGHSCARASDGSQGRSNNREFDMSEKIKSEMISRRGAFSLLGLAAALGFVMPATVLTLEDAEAQTTTGAPAPTGGTSGMQRRQERRKGRHERRAKRRGGGEAKQK